jgi:Zn-dependent M28 family amino/carboxypeptidase
MRAGLEAAGTSGGYDQPFSFTRASGRRAPNLVDPPGQGQTLFPDAANLVGRISGTDTGAQAIVITAHYDHLGVGGGRIFPGADDNASGVAALIAVAQYVIAHRPRHPMIFAALDAEELGLEGAKAFLRAPPVPRSTIGLNINFDMVSRNDRNEIYASGTYHYPWTKAIVDEVQRRSSLKILFGHDRPRTAGATEDDWTMQSDHGVFHQAQLPFVYFGVEDHPDYHQPTDTADRIDPAFFSRVVDMLIDAVVTFDQRMN